MGNKPLVKQCVLTIDELLTIVLQERAFRVIPLNGPVYRELSNVKDNNTFVLENDNWSIGFDTSLMEPCDAGYIRLWNRKDWETCDNRNKKAVALANARHEAHVKAKLHRRETVMNVMRSSGVAENVIDMMMKAYTDEQIEGLYHTMTANDVKTI